MVGHLGYDKHSYDGNNTDSSRNGFSKKTLETKYVPIEFNVGPLKKSGVKNIPLLFILGNLN